LLQTPEKSTTAKQPPKRNMLQINNKNHYHWFSFFHADDSKELIASKSTLECLAKECLDSTTATTISRRATRQTMSIIKSEMILATKHNQDIMDEFEDHVSFMINRNVTCEEI
jgi:hypothetical protein